MHPGSFGEGSEFAGDLVLYQWQLFQGCVDLTEFCNELLLGNRDAVFEIINLGSQCFVGDGVLAQLEVENPLSRRRQVRKCRAKSLRETLVGRIERLKEILEVR